MSLDIHLVDPTATYKVEDLYEVNITNNLGRMAHEAGFYKAMWNPLIMGLTMAKEVAPILEEGIKKLKADPDHYRKFNSKNGWGTYEDLLRIAEEYLSALKRYPEAIVYTFT